MSDADGGVRRLVLVHGRERARAMVEPEQRALVDIAAEVLGDDAGRIGISYSGFCLTGLPHKRLPDEQAWEKRGHRVTLLVEPGRMKQDPSAAKMVGVPYGARARMILLYLQTQAVRTGSREVELGRSLHDWLGRMGLAWGGETGKALREQAARIAACSLKFFWEGEDASGWEAGRFVRSGLRFHSYSGDERQGDLWEDRVVLDEAFYAALRRLPVPLELWPKLGSGGLGEAGYRGRVTSLPEPPEGAIRHDERCRGSCRASAGCGGGPAGGGAGEWRPP